MIREGFLPVPQTGFAIYSNRVMKRRSTNDLSTYRAKRKFSSTPEPPPKVTAKRAGKRLRFCVQKHLASALHYDFRLEFDGVLLSWAVPKGPSLDPADKRLAMRTENHPLDYGDFEGIIPEGYGAGIVLLWDTGTWACEQEDIAAALKRGELKFSLDGVKLKGSWVLVRTRGGEGKEQWLLIKHRDRWSGTVDIASFAPQSVKSFGDFPDLLRNSERLEIWSKKPPVKSGATAELYRDVIRRAREKPPARSKQAAASEPGRVKSGGAKVGRTKVGRAKSPPSKSSSADSPVATPVHSGRLHSKSSSSNGATSKTPRSQSGRELPAKSLQFGRNIPKLSNQDKPLYPDGFTKGQLVDYYTKIAPFILPHLRGRAATLKRYPDGVESKFFFEKRCASHRPDWVKTATVARSDSEESIAYCLIDDLSTLVWAANMAAIELHVPLALAKNPDRPTSLVFDLDPGLPADIRDCARVALHLRELLTDLGLESFIKTSGSKGLHMLVPLNGSNPTFDQTKSFARAIATMVQKEDAARVTATMSKSLRTGKVFVDWSQNDRNKTTVCCWSMRATMEPSVSSLIEWDHVNGIATARVSPREALADTVNLSELNALVVSLRQKLPLG